MRTSFDGAEILRPLTPSPIISIDNFGALCLNTGMRCFNPIAIFLCFVCGTIRAQTNTNAITREMLEQAEKLVGLNFSDKQNDLLLRGLREQLRTYEDIRKFPLSNSIPSAMLFNPLPVGWKFETARQEFKMSAPGVIKLPENLDDLAFCSVGELASLIKSRQITSEKLTRLYLDRLKKYGPKLLCVVTLTEDLALAQARRADRQVAEGKYRDPVHGIPYGVKDLLATKGIRTTWGSA